MVRIVSAWYFLFVIVVLILFLLSTLRHLLLHLLLSCLLLLLLCLRLNVNINVDLVLFLVRVDLFGVIDIDSKIKRLVFNFVTFHISWFLIRLRT